MSVRAPVGDLNITPIDMCLGRGVCALRMKNGNQDFLFYLMKYYMPQLINKESGTVFGSVNKQDIIGIEVEIPKDEQQQRVISRYLCMLDDKIELNIAINNHLEQIAQTIFKSYTKNIKYAKRFTDVAYILSGGTPKTTIDEYWNGSIPFFTPKDVKGTYVLTTEKSLTETGLKNCNSQLYPPNTIFVTARGTVGKIAMAGVSMAMNQSCYALIGKPGYGQLFLYNLAQEMVKNLKHKASGAVFDAIVIRDFDNEIVSIPSLDVVNEFENIVKPIYEIILHNAYESINLIDLRDSLLPQLISGELTVADISNSK